MLPKSIKSLTSSGLTLTSNAFAAEYFVQKFPDIIEDYTPDQIFNCNETGLCHKMFPGRTLTTVHATHFGNEK